MIGLVALILLSAISRRRKHDYCMVEAMAMITDVLQRMRADIGEMSNAMLITFVAGTYSEEDGDISNFSPMFESLGNPLDAEGWEAFVASLDQWRGANG